MKLKLSAEYLLKIQLTNNSIIANLPSGRSLDFPIEVEICDIYSQKIVTMNNGLITARLIDINESSITSYKKLSGVTTQKITNGSAFFDNLVIFSNPVDTILALEFSSDLILKNIDNFDYFEVKSEYTLEIPIEVRECLPGEIYDSLVSACFVCPLNYYSFDIKDKKCKECLLDMDCYGGMNVSLKSGYWRSNIYSDNILECKPNPESCL